MSSRRATAMLTVWWASLAVSLWTLQAMGTGDLATPPLPWHWGRWLGEVDTAAAVVALLRLGALVATWYLAALTLVGAVAAISGRDRTAWIDRLTPAFLRRLLLAVRGTVTAATVTVALGPLATASAMAQDAPQPAPRPPSEVDQAVPAPDPITPTRPVVAGVASQQRFALVLAPFAPVTSASHDRPDVPAQWVVEPGDHFWHIALEVLTDAWGREPTDREVDAFWRTLVEHNRGRLRARSNPDLLYPGQVLDLPSAPPDASSQALGL